MNYLKLINDFWTSNEVHSFRTSEISLYFYLLQVCNRLSWSESFKRNNRKIQADLGISFNTLKEARNSLKQAGLINFKSRSGNGDVTYTLTTSSETLSKFDEVACEVSTEVGIEVGIEVSSTKDKLNKNINKTDWLNNNINNNISDIETSQSASQSVSQFFLEIYKKSFSASGALTLTSTDKKTLADVAARHGWERIEQVVAYAAATDTLNGNSPSGFTAIVPWLLKHFDELDESERRHAERTAVAERKAAAEREATDYAARQRMIELTEQRRRDEQRDRAAANAVPMPDDCENIKRIMKLA